MYDGQDDESMLDFDWINGPLSQDLQQQALATLEYLRGQLSNYLLHGNWDSYSIHACIDNETEIVVTVDCEYYGECDFEKHISFDEEE